MDNKIKITLGKLSTIVEESDNWEETKFDVLGAVHRILLARDTKRKITGIDYG